MRLLLPLLLAGCTQPHVPETRPANACEAGAFARAEHVLQVQVGRQHRRALVWFPPGPGPHDVIVNFHEFRANPRTQVRYSGWADHVAESNAILVAPDARYAVWNAGECCGRAVDKHIDDVAFLDAMMARLDEVACTSGRVVATGIGNGGMMAEMWACESEHPDAVVSVGGSLQWKECRNDRPVPYLHYHGSDDAFIPMDASPTGLAKQEGIERPLSHALELWEARNQAKKAGIVKDGDLHCTSWTGQAPMASCIIQGGTDTWPGAPDGVVDSKNPLRDATMGALTWVRAAWDAPAPKPSAAPAPAPDTDAPTDTDGTPASAPPDTDAVPDTAKDTDAAKASGSAE